MNKQTKAQRLADEIGDLASEAELHYYTGNVREAAAILRRQDELLRQALEALDAIRSNMRMNAPQLAGKVWGFADDVSAAIRAHREAK